jgi:hypothetical protein
MQRTLLAIAMVVVVSLLVVVGLFYFGNSLGAANISREISLPILTIVAVVLMLAVLTLVAIVFSILELTDKSRRLHCRRARFGRLSRSC